MSGVRLSSLTNRLKHSVVATFFVATQIVFPMLASGLFVGHAAAVPSDNKVTICHRTDSVSNPYNQESVDFDAATGALHDNGQGDHTSHTGPVVSSETQAQTLKDNHQDWGDIIPPYSWPGDRNHAGGSYPGLNWTSDGQNVWNNQCNYPPSLTVVKQVINDNGGTATADDFTLRVNGTALTAGTVSNNGLTDTYTFPSPIINTSYTVSEDNADGYTQTGLTCKDDSNQHTVSNPVKLSAAQSVTCIITNDDNAPSLKVVKNVDNSKGGTAIADGFTMRVNGTALTGGVLSNNKLTDTYTYSNPSVGTPYTVSEDTTTGYVGGSWACTDDATQQNVGNPVTLSAGQHVTCAITNAYVPVQTGSITITKDAVPDSNQSFSFTATGTGLSNFSLTNNGTTSNSNTFSSLAAGSYSISEQSTAGWDFAGLNCSDPGGTSVINTTGSQASITLVAGDHVTCTYTNRQRGRVVVHKVTNPANDPTVFQVTASGTSSVTGATAINGNATQSLSTSQDADYDVAQGTYSVAETTASGWTQTGATCTNGQTLNSIVINGNTPLVDGVPTVTCTITNTRDTGTIKVVKQLLPSNDAGKFNLNITGPTTYTATNQGNNGTTGTQTVVTGSYTVSETAGTSTNMADYGSSYSCTDGNTTIASGTGTTSVSFSVAKGQNVVCTFTNTKLAKLTIVKATNPDSSSQAFAFTASGPSITQQNNAFMLDTSPTNTYPNNVQYDGLTPGDYTVTEGYTSGWQLTNLVCSGITYTWPVNNSTLALTLPAGANVTCTFTNTQLGSISGVKYEVNADSSVVGTVQGLTIYLLVNGHPITSTVTGANGTYSFDGLLPGNYSLAEQSVSGWTPIYTPSGVNLAAGQNTANKNFGNFRNASISGYKFNDLNGDGIWEQNQGEIGLKGWTITLYNGKYLNNKVDQQSTGSDGSYSFDNLAPGTYKLCETMQSGWAATFPNSTGCQTVDITLSGHDYANTNFGNQGRGSITVVKNVDDGFGRISPDVNYWTWSYSGDYGAKSGIASGSHNQKSVAAGSYTVSETHNSDYHLVSVSCTDGRTTLSVDQSESVAVSVAPYHNIVCTYNNIRNTGTVTVNKSIVPANDSGKFDLHIKGSTSYTKYYQSNGGTTGKQTVVTGNYTVSESASWFTNTKLSDYRSSFDCTNGVHGYGTETPSFTVSSGQDVSCTFTNKRLATITVIKDARPKNDPQAFSFSIDRVPVDEGHDGSWLFNAKDKDKHHDYGNDGVSFKLDNYFWSFNIPDRYTDTTGPGTYVITEDKTPGWSLTDISCTGAETWQHHDKLYVTVDYGQNVVCTYVNEKHGSITVNKQIYTVNQADQNQSFDFTTKGRGLSDFSLTGQDGSNSVKFSNLRPDKNYTITEQATPNWQLAYLYCSDGNGDGWWFDDNSVGTVDLGKAMASIELKPGENVTCTFFNIEDTKVVVTKYNDYNHNGQYDPNGTEGGDPAEPTLSGWQMNLSSWFDENTNDALHQTTGSDGTATFASVNPGFYNLGETMQDGWTQSNIQCDNPSPEDLAPIFDLPVWDFLPEGFYNQLEQPGSVFAVPGATINCTVGNYRTNDAINLTKTNNKPQPTTVGDTVTYTLTVTVPENSGAVFGATVTDLPPANFHFNGNWTATSTNSDHNVTGDINSQGGPSYGSPGTWYIGNLIPGEIVTITYQATIGSNVSDGAYPDLAYVSGYEMPDGTPFLGNLSAATPFVGTQVSVVSTLPAVTYTAGQVLGASVLVNTGTNLLAMQFILPIVLVGGVYLVRRVNRTQEKGGK